MFEGSGLFAGEAAVIGREFRHPVSGWLNDNYFHQPASDDLVRQLAQPVGVPARAAVLIARRITRRVRAAQAERLDSVGLPVLGARRRRRRSVIRGGESAA